MVLGLLLVGWVVMGGEPPGGAAEGPAAAPNQAAQDSVPADKLAPPPVKLLALGDWSEAMADNRGYTLRGRLVLCQHPRGDGHTETVVYVELAEAGDSIGEPMQLYCDLGKHDFRPEYRGGLKCKLRDQDGQPVATTPGPFGGAVPQSLWVTLPTDASIRLRASPFGIYRPGALVIVSDLASWWVIPGDDTHEYTLSGTFTIDPTDDVTPPADGVVWRGTLELPGVKVANKFAE
jgi:hypothetical protein